MSYRAENSLRIMVDKMEELVSVIVPAYNAEDTILNCINSLLCQTHSNLEIIIVNDGSTDQTQKILNGMDDKRIKIITKKNSGVSSARNDALKVAQGKYIGFVDSDDYVKKHMYETMLKQIKKDHSDMALCGYDVICANGERKKSDFIIGNHLYQSDEFLIQANQNLYSIYYGAPWNKLFNRQILKGITFDPEISYGEDFIFNMEVMCNVHKVSVLDEALYIYDARNENSLSRKNVRGDVLWKNAKVRFEKYVKACKKHKMFEKIEENTCRWLAYELISPVDKILYSNETNKEKIESYKDLLENDLVRYILNQTNNLNHKLKIIKYFVNKGNYNGLRRSLSIFEKLKGRRFKH